MAGARRPEDLDAWALAWELKQRVYALTKTPPASRDRDFCDDIRRAARSAPHNTSEGFYRFVPGEFTRFLGFARGSLGEVRDQLRHAHDEQYVNEAEFAELTRLTDRAIGANTRLQDYLRTAPDYFNRPRKRKRPNPKPPSDEP